jgi:HEAT repeats
MICHRVPIFAAVLLGSAAILRAQPTPPAPPAPPAIPVTPAPEPPVPPLSPTPPEPPIPAQPPIPPEAPIDFDFQFDFQPDLSNLPAQIHDGMQAAKDALKNLQFGPELSAQINESVNRAMDAVNANLRNGFFQRGLAGNSNDDRLYENGQRALDRSQWNVALTDFTQVANHGGPRADGALYWKAYALNKLGRRDEAVAAIADLRKSYAKSRWLDDASALEIEVKQQAGQNVSPDSQPDEELKLLALNALVNSDPDRALPLLEGILKGSEPPRLKERALFVLAQNGSPQAQQLLSQMARGTVNPDLQLKAIQYLGLAREQNNGQVLADVYTAANDREVKGAIINALALQERNTKTLVDLARKEHDPEMKLAIVRRLSDMKSKDALDYMMELLKSSGQEGNPK